MSTDLGSLVWKDRMPRSAQATRALRPLVILLTLALVAWPARPVSAATASTLKVLSYNVYYGGELELLFTATSQTELFHRVGVVWEQVQATDLPARAEAVADQIAASDPHVVGLQETPLWRSQFPGDGTFSEATTIRYDFLDLLLDALQARGRHYAVAATETNLDAEIPRLDPDSPSFIEDIRLTDRDVILVRTDLPPNVFSFSNGRGEDFVHNFVFPSGIFAGVVVPRGWTSVDVSIAGRPVRVVNTHLERFSPTDQVLQGQEILDGPADTSLPTVLLGDLNSAASGGVPGQSDTPTYGNFIAAGFADAWDVKHDGADGFTCCQTADLDDPTALFERIDFVLARDMEVSTATRIGEEEEDRTASGFWPSDHCGVRAVLHVA
jgi:hypothetical protein